MSLLKRIESAKPGGEGAPANVPAASGAPPPPGGQPPPGARRATRGASAAAAHATARHRAGAGA